jgi:hypothetical protein
MQSAYAGKTSRKIILPLLARRAEVRRRRAERGEGRGEESKYFQDSVVVLHLISGFNVHREADNRTARH